MDIKKVLPDKKSGWRRVIEFFDKKGFYIVLFLCISIIAATTVTVITRNTQMDFDSGDNIFIEPDNALGNESPADAAGLAAKTGAGNELAAETPIKLAQNSSSIATGNASSTTNSNASGSTNKPAVSPEQGSGQAIANPEAVPALASGQTAVQPFKPAYPVNGNIILEFAQDKLVFNKTLQEWGTHDGIDILGERGTAVKAAFDGSVSSIKNDPRFGIIIIIDHQNGYKTVYANLAGDGMVQPNQKIKQGDTIGAIGDTATFESGDQPHLHFEILKSGVLVNPLDLLPKR